MNTEKPRVVNCVPKGATKKTKYAPFVLKMEDRVLHLNKDFVVTLPGVNPVKGFNIHAFVSKINNLNLAPLHIIRDYFEDGAKDLGRILTEYNMRKLEEEYTRNLNTIRRCQQANRFIREMWWQVKSTGEVYGDKESYTKGGIRPNAK